MTSSEPSSASNARNDHDGDPSFLDGVADPIGAVTRAIWVLVLIRGIAAIVFGILAIVAPLMTGVAIVYVFAAFALVEGVIQIVHAVRVRARDRRWGWLLAMGIIAILAGIVAFVFPGGALLVYGSFVLAIIAFYAVAMGIAGFPAAASATDGARQVLGYVVAVLSIVLGVFLAIFLLIDPAVAILNLIWVVGVWALVVGVMLVIAAISARVRNRPSRSGSAAV